MKVLTRTTYLLFLISLLVSCKTYKPIKTLSLANQTELEVVAQQLEQVNPNEMIKVTTLNKKKYQFEYQSHTQDTLTAILYHRLPGESQVHSKIKMKVALNTVKTVKNKQTNYPLSIGVPLISVLGGLYIWHINTPWLFDSVTNDDFFGL